MVVSRWLHLAAMALLACPLVLFTSCGGEDGHDADGDGYAADDDCDDTDETVHPHASEDCDGLDNDCNGEIDEGSGAGATIFYPDGDGDGYGLDTEAIVACEQPAGHSTVGADCDDTDAEVKPGADEYCDGYDNDCDGLTDEPQAVDAGLWYTDEDGDGYGDDATETAACEQPDDTVSQGGDCDDGNADVYPDAPDACDGIQDTNCDGFADELEVDDDGDGASECGGDCDDDAVELNPTDADGDGYSTCDDDCDDTESSVHPGATEVCGNDVDEDCNGTPDDGCR